MPRPRPTRDYDNSGARSRGKAAAESGNYSQYYDAAANAKDYEKWSSKAAQIEDGLRRMGVKDTDLKDPASAAKRVGGSAGQSLRQLAEARDNMYAYRPRTGGFEQGYQEGAKNKRAAAAGGKKVDAVTPFNNLLDTLDKFRLAIGSKPQATLDDLLAALGGPVTAGGIPMPDKGAFLAPYDTAEAATRNVHSQVVPTIDNIFATLQNGMGSQEQEFTNRMGELTAAAGQQQQQAQAAIPVQQAIAVDPSQVVGSLAAELQGNNVANAQAQGQRNQADLSMLNQIAAMGQADSASVQQSAQAVGAGARANADAQLQQALNAIGMGRAQAESQYANQAADVAAKNASLQMDAARLNMQQRDQAMQEWDRVNSDILKQAKGSAWDTNIRALQRQDPDTYMSLVGPDGVIDVAGTDRNEVNYATALSMIEQEAAAGGIDPRTARTLQRYVQEYYIGSDKIDPKRFAAMGGDPAYLRSLGLG